MNTRTPKIAILVGIGMSLLLAIQAPHLAGAMEMNTAETSTDNNTGKGTDAATLREQAKALREEKQKAAKETRDAKKAAKCQEHQAHITQLMSRIDTRSEHIFKRLGNITTLVENYYTKQELKVDGYDSLVADVAQKKAAANAKLNVLLDHSAFNCDAENPREAVQTYRTHRQEKVVAMKVYRQAVLTLLTEVKKAAVAAQEAAAPTGVKGDE